MVKFSRFLGSAVKTVLFLTVGSRVPSEESVLLLVIVGFITEREGTNTSLGLIKSQHMWLKWLDTGEADCVRVFASDFSKAFDSANHFILLNKFKELSINPYIGLLLFFYLAANNE